jgi:hypothetical protein
MTRNLESTDVGWLLGGPGGPGVDSVWPGGVKIGMVHELPLMGPSA